ncbi:MAG: bifunctional methylenetetrahydrofolate dehydrogenase/methenyltetrahydrofolate cyclohydrolase FolD [Pyrinomonadaceae bacterium]|jgi:methylenetetrahydrofolate dehydrogenase (NADP+)/methenyltetrahydrofolate cyclohydrolase
MSAKILNGREIAEAVLSEVKGEVRRLAAEYGIQPGLAVIRVGNDPASAVYVANKVKACREAGIRSEHIHLPESVSSDELFKRLEMLNSDSQTDGILVQLPLPDHLDSQKILESIEVEKDVDGFHPMNVGRLSQGRECLAPCTPAGVIEILKRSGIKIEGQNAVIVGRSNIVGKPLAAMLLNENATVTICHSRTRNLEEITRSADILVAAIGRPGFIREQHIRPGAAVIDVGINRVSDKDFAAELFEGEELGRRISAIENRGSTLVGDVNPREAMRIAGYYTPVPGGVGLLTVAMLLKNTIAAAEIRRRIDETAKAVS